MPITHGYIALPPDGSGKPTAQSVMYEINYTNGTIEFEEGDVITFSTSPWKATVIEEGETVATGEIHVRIDEPVPTIPSVVDGEDILVNNVKYAEVANDNAGAVYFPQNVIVGRDMINHLDIDELGSAVVRFPEGSPQFDAFGKLQVSQQHKVAEYVHQYDDLSPLFTTEITGGASKAYDNNTRGVTLTCGTAAGDKIVRTSNQYHHYQAGTSQLLEFTGAMGDTGKENVVRRAGYYDNNNGLYIQMDGSTFGVGIRSKSTGSVVDTVVTQPNWNRDRLDGTKSEFNPSGKLADPSKDNIYWIDMQWLGAGTVRFGLVIDGVRIVVHQIDNSNTQVHSYMSTGSLPYRYEQENTGLAASPSTLKMFCASIKTEGELEPFLFAGTHESSVSVTTTSEECLLGIRAAQTFKSFDNRVSIYPREFTIHNSASEPAVVSLALGATITGGTWTSKGGESSAEVNDTATSVSGGNTGLSTIIGAGETRTIQFNTLKDNRIGIRRNADITTAIEVALKAKLLFSGTGGNVYVSFNWDEVRD